MAAVENNAIEKQRESSDEERVETLPEINEEAFDIPINDKGLVIDFYQTNDDQEDKYDPISSDESKIKY